MSCPVCHERKPRRACPALGVEICTVCCGTKRMVEIRCPSDCCYLETARTHPAAVVRRQQELDLRVFLPTVQDLADEQAQMLWFVLSLVRAFQPDDFVRLTDDEIAEAADSLASTFETAVRGLIFEHRPTSLAAQRLSTAVKDGLAKLPDASRPGFDRNIAIVLRRVEKGAKEARKQFGGDVTAYLQIVHRLLKPGENAPEVKDVSRGETPSGLIIP